MPYLYRVDAGMRVWNVESVVDASGRSNPYDVKLVQFFIKKLHKATPRRGSPQVEQTGIYDASTRQEVMYYQLKNADLCTPDGRVSPMRNNSTSWAGGKVWTIAILEIRYVCDLHGVPSGKSLTSAGLGPNDVTAAMYQVPFDRDIDPMLAGYLMSSLYRGMAA